MAPSSKLQVGVVGIGRIGQQHALNILHKTPRADLLCACSPAKADLDWGEQHLAAHGVKLYDSFEDMIETPGLQAVIIASISSLHMQQTLAALDRGIHVLCEKPVCTSVTELEALVDRCERDTDTSMMVGFVRRFDESYMDASEKSEAGRIGEPIVFRSHGCELLDTSPWFKQYLKNSGGIFIDTIIHDIDLSLLFFGEDSTPKSVAAVGVAAVHTELEDSGDADYAVGHVEYWNGKIASFYNSRAAAVGWDNMTEIFGTAGKVSVNGIQRQKRVEFADSDGTLKSEPPGSWYDRYKEAFVTEVNSWTNAILDGKPMPIPLRSAMTGLVIATALQESMKTGKRIDFGRDGRRLDGSGPLLRIKGKI